ncbi:MAG: imidazolonepropionase [Bradymonadia bacterium]
MTSWSVSADQVLTFSDDGVGLVEHGAVWAVDNDIRWVGPLSELPSTAPRPRRHLRVLMPAWLECHTHAIFGGTRHEDFARRNAGTSYAEILEAGGGIMSSVTSSRAATDAVLLDTLLHRLELFWAQGVAVVEVKTGYALSLAQELRHLRLIREAGRVSPVHVVSTCLAGHTVPAESAADRDAYVSMVCDELLPAIVAENLADQFDVFCDRGAFTIAESRRLLEAASAAGLPLRVHAEELARTGATALACELAAKSADHLEHIDESDIAAMAAADVAAVLLPTVTVFLDLPERAPARALADAGVRIAVSTDFNPGSAHGLSLQLAVSLSCSLHKLTPAEALRGVTRVPAEVLGVDGRFGRIAAGYSATLLSFDVPDWSAVPWYLDHAPLSVITSS